MINFLIPNCTSVRPKQKQHSSGQLLRSQTARDLRPVAGKGILSPRAGAAMQDSVRRCRLWRDLGEERGQRRDEF